MNPNATSGGPRLGPVLARSAPAAMGMLVILVLGVGALRVGQSNLEAAERDRVAARSALVLGMRGNAEGTHDPMRATAVPALTRYTREASAYNESLLKQVTGDPGNSAAFAALVSADGRLVQSIPADTAIDVGVLGSAWQQALQGRGGLTDSFRRNNELITAEVLPVGEGTPWGALVIGQALVRSATQTQFVQLGSQNGEPGGLFVTDRKGVVVEAWDAGRVGQSVLTADEVASLRPGQARQFTSWRDGSETLVIATELIDGFTMGFEQQTERLVGDLRDAQHQRDLTLLGVLGAALAGLVFFQLSRELTARRDEARVDALLRNGQDMVAVVGSDGTLTFVSAAIEGLLDQSAAAWLRRPLADLCHREDAARLEQLLADPAAGPLLNLRLRTGDGEYRWFDVEASDLRRHPEVGGILLTCHEIGERKRLQDELSYQATHDRLTGLPNRAEFSERLERLVVQGRPARRFALLYLDLDHFKPVNDTLGHDAGDHVLITVSERLRMAAGPTGFVSRLGGDEFAILLDGAGEAEAMLVASALLEAARAPIAVSATLAHLDASIGIALADPSMVMHSVEQLVRQADEAMYRAKKGGRGRFDFATTWSSSAPPDATVQAGGGSRSDRRPGPAPDDPPPAPVEVDLTPLASSTAARRRRQTSMLPMAVAAFVVVGIAAIGFAQTIAGQRTAEAERLRDHESLTARSAVFYSSLYDPRRLVPLAVNAPWTLDGGPVDQAIIRAWSSAPTTGRDATAFLMATDGRLLAGSPPGAEPTTSPTNPTFQDAVAGRPSYVPWVDDRDQPRSYFYLPVTRENRTAAVVILAVSVRHGIGQEQLEGGGQAGWTSGGWSLLDSDGVAYSSWNPNLIGQRIADKGDLVSVQAGDARAVERDGRLLIVAPMTATSVPTYLALDVSSSDFYRDLRVGQLQRDLSLLLLVVTAVAGLALVNHRREQAVRRNEARLDALLQNAHDVVVVLDGDGRATFVSSAVQRLLGYEPFERVGQMLLDLVHPGDRDRVVQMVGTTHDQVTGSVRDVRVRDSRGGYRWFDIDAVDLRHHKEVAGVLLTCHEVSERKALQDQLAYRAKRDPLTGLPNRATLATRLEQLVESPDSGPFAILFVDLDHFKPVNDTLGHDAGDEVLRVIADRFRKSVRGEDDGGAGDLVCRLGGDEFAIVLMNVTEAIAEATAARLVHTARDPIQVGAHVVQIGATIGVSVSHPHREDPDQAIRKADQAMYQAKEAGRNTFAMATSED